MPLHAIDEHPPYAGMATAIPLADVPAGHAKKIVGFTPARYSRLDLAPLLKRLQTTFYTPPFDIHGTAIWLSADGLSDTLLLFTGTSVRTYGLAQNWLYDERPDGQHSFWNISPINMQAFTVAQNAVFGVNSVQFDTELIISIDQTLYRYTGSNLYPLGLPNLYSLYIGSPLTLGTPGSGILNGIYDYLITFVDEKGRESSPSRPVATVTLTNNNQPITLSGTVPSGYGIANWNLYRLNPGATVYKLVSTIAIGTTTFTDNTADDVVNASTPAPDPGENDPPNDAWIMEVWPGKNRLILNDATNPAAYQVSNADSPTQFSSLDLPTNVADGFRGKTLAEGDNEVTGFANLGSLLVVFTRSTRQLLFGDDITTFTLRSTGQKGCQNYASVQQLGNSVLYLGDDGVYTVTYEDGYIQNKVSTQIDDQFLGFFPIHRRGDPTSVGRPVSVQTQNALRGAVNSFVSENRYYLSMGDRTLCYDGLSGEWTDTGWGFVKTVSRYFSLVPFTQGAAPESFFITLGACPAFDGDTTDFASSLHYFTVADTEGDRDAPGLVNSQIIMRPVDLSPQGMRQRLKRVVKLVQYGTTEAPIGKQIGQAVWYVNEQPAFVRPILAHVVSSEYKNALFEIAAPSIAGQVIHCVLSFTEPDISLQSSIFEYVALN